MTMDERYKIWSERWERRWRDRNLPVCRDIERSLLRQSRGNPDQTAEVLNARQLRKQVVGD